MPKSSGGLVKRIDRLHGSMLTKMLAAKPAAQGKGRRQVTVTDRHHSNQGRIRGGDSPYTPTEYFLLRPSNMAVHHIWPYTPMKKGVFQEIPAYFYCQNGVF
jgi:hypothetical protein